MKRVALVILMSLSACVLEEGDEHDPELAELEQEATLPVPVTTLYDGQAVTLSATSGSRYFKIDVPAGYDKFTVTRSGSQYGSSMYVKRGSLPSPTSYDCGQLDSYSLNSCNGAYDWPAPAGTYYILIKATTGYTNLTLRANYWNIYAPLPNNTSLWIGAGYGQDFRYKLDVPQGATVTFRMTMNDQYLDGWVDLIVRRAAPPVSAPDVYYDCKREIIRYEGIYVGTCTFTNSPGGTYYVDLDAHRRYAGTFSASYKMPLVNTTSSTNSL